MIEINNAWKRDFNVYDRLKKLGIGLGKKEDLLLGPRGVNICMLTFTPSGLVYTSGASGGSGSVNDDDDSVERAKGAAREMAILHVQALHWGLQPFGDLNDVWYCVKCIGMVNSPGGGSFSRSHDVTNGYTKFYHDVFGGPLSEFAEDGLDSSLSGWHARSAVAGYDLPANTLFEPEMILQIDPELSLKIIRERGPHI